MYIYALLYCERMACRQNGKASGPRQKTNKDNFETMNPKQKRLDILRKLIVSTNAASQEDILPRLAAEGFAVTQATLSRDLKELKVAKMPDGSGGYRYVLPEMAPAAVNLHHGASASGRDHVLEGIISLEFSGQMCVLKTRPGYANMIAAILDAPLNAKIMGSIAGDDTILLVLRENTDHEAISADMETVIPGISARRI